MTSAVSAQERLLAVSVACILAVGVFVFVRSRRKKHVILSEERILPAGEQQHSHADASSGRGSRSDSSAAVPANGATDDGTFVHPDGPNIGPASGSSWFRDNPEKTDLLHTGHRRGGKLLIVTVGLPGRGKTYIASKVARYLRWINYRTKVFSLAKYRQSRVGTQKADFFDFSNEANIALRNAVLTEALEDVMRYLNRGGEVAIVDGTFSTIERRAMIRNRVAQEDGFGILWLESISDDTTVRQNIESMKASPDFVGIDEFEKRVQHYKQHYQTVEASEGAYVKVWEGGSRLEVAGIRGYLPTKVVSFVMNLHTRPRPVYLTRHGESVFNQRDLIGGDSELSPRGQRYAEALAEFISQQPDMSLDKLCVWTSTLKRARQTAKPIKCKKYVEWRALREIEVGICDGLTYEQVKMKFPEEYRAREQDKLRYRYPRGESYLDIIARLEPVILELERQEDPLLIIGHQAVLRCLYAYFLDLPPEEVPYLSIPLHTLIMLDRQVIYGAKERRTKILVEDDPEESA